MSLRVPITTRARAISLIEVLVVVSVIVLLLAILVPSLRQARRQARLAVCRSNLRQWGSAALLYAERYRGYLPTEGTTGGNSHELDGAWYNELPPLLGLPRYRDVGRIDKKIKEFPSLSVWICPEKNRTRQYKSGSGQNQFHYAMNLVLDGVGTAQRPSEDVPGFLDAENHKPVRIDQFAKKPLTVFLFEIAWNSPRGGPRDVATVYQRDFSGNPVGRFHGDYANVLRFDGSVGWCATDDLVTDRDFRNGDIRWHNSRVYWGFPRPGQKLPEGYYD